MEDRLIRGFVAGIVGSIAMNIWSFIAGIMNFTTLRMVDWASIIIYRHMPPFSFAEITFALLSQILFSGALGVVFAYLVNLVTSQNLIFRGWLFSVISWFMIYSVTTLFKLEGTVPLPINTAISDFIASTVYGLAMPVVLSALVAKPSVISQRTLMEPAMKLLDDKDDNES
jgi:hypothetical protein